MKAAEKNIAAQADVTSQNIMQMYYYFVYVVLILSEVERFNPKIQNSMF